MVSSRRVDCRTTSTQSIESGHKRGVVLEADHVKKVKNILVIFNFAQNQSKNFLYLVWLTR